MNRQIAHQDDDVYTHKENMLCLSTAGEVKAIAGCSWTHARRCIAIAPGFSHNLRLYRFENLSNPHCSLTYACPFC